jgi:hypothetical protein
MRQVHEDDDGQTHQPEQSMANATVLGYVSQSDAYRNRLTRELAGVKQSPDSKHRHRH